jgi:type I restriction enzyme M protein
MSAGFLSNMGQEGNIREKIIRVKNYLDAVIQLPKGLFTNAIGVSASILVFKKNRKPDAKVMFLDATGMECNKNGPKQVLTNDSVTKIVDIINHKQEIDETSKLISLEEIYKNECSLNVSLYVSKKIIKEQIDIHAVNLELKRLKKEDASLEQEFKEMEKELIYNEGGNL